MRTPKFVTTQVLRRDNYTCQGCGARPDPTPRVILHVHHMPTSPKDDPSAINNLITLCSHCHAKYHRSLFVLSKEKL